MRLVKHPVLCNYYVTYRCNATCHFCDIWEKPSPYIQLKDVVENLKQLKRIGVKVIDFTGGEPLLHRDLHLFLEEAKKLKFLTTVTTNALLYPKHAESLRGKIDMLHFSLDYYTAEKHNQSRGVDCYDHVMKSIEIALSLGEKPDIIATVLEDNMEEIEAIYENICLPNQLMLLLNPGFDYNAITLRTSTDSFERMTQLAKKKWVYLNDAFIKLRKDGGNQIDNPVCKAASTTLVISPQNELVLPCYHLNKGSIPIQNNLETLYQSDEVQEMVQLEGRYEACQGCTINCYMQPSFATHLNKYFWSALPSTIKYNRLKGTWKSLL